MNSPQPESLTPEKIETALKEEDPEYFNHLRPKVLRNAISQALTYEKNLSYPRIRDFVKNLLIAEQRDTGEF